MENKTRSPLVPLRFLRSPGRLTGLTAVLVAAAGHASIGFFLALHFQQVRSMSAIATTAAFLPFRAMLPVAGALASRSVARVPSRTVAAAGLATGAAGLLLIGQLGADTPYAGTLLAGMPAWSTPYRSGGVATTEEIARVTLWLASDDASYVVGHDLVVDGAGTA